MKCYMAKENWGQMFALYGNKIMGTDIEVEITPELWEEHERVVEALINLQDRLSTIYNLETGRDE